MGSRFECCYRVLGSKFLGILCSFRFGCCSCLGNSGLFGRKCMFGLFGCLMLGSGSKCRLGMSLFRFHSHGKVGHKVRKDRLISNMRFCIVGMCRFG